MKPEELKKVEGIYVVSITPFKDDLSLDEEGVRKNIRFLVDKGIKKGTGAVITCCSTGECFSLTDEERIKICEIVMDEAKDNIPVLVGCNHTNTQKVIEYTKHAESAGAAGVMIMPPYYGTASDDMIIKFYSDIAESSAIGIMAYNNPGVTGIDIPVDVMLKLSEIENVVLYKDCTENQFKAYITGRILIDKLNVLDGSNGDVFVPASLMAGKTSFISSYSNFAPEIVLDIYKSYKEGDYKKACKLSTIFDALNTLAYDYFNSQGGYITLIKESTNIRGVPAGPARPPLLPITGDKKEKLVKTVKNILAMI